MKTEKSIDLGRLQSAFETSAKELSASERALKRAQDDRDAKRTRHAEAAEALKNGFRTVQG